MDNEVKVEELIRQRFQEEASAFHGRSLDPSAIFTAHQRWRSARLVLVPLGVALSLALVSVTAIEMWDRFEPKGRTVIAAGSDNELTETEQAGVASALSKFVRKVEHTDADADADADAEASWRLLSTSAQGRIGSLEAWSKQRSGVASFLQWVDDAGVDITVAKIPPRDGSRYVATAAAPPEGGKALLQPIPVVEEAGQFRIDLVSGRFDQPIRIEPRSPRFYACIPGECDDLENSWPPLPDGTLLSFLLEPATDVEAVWFAVGSEWVGAAELSPSGDQTTAEATFEGSAVGDGTKVLVVAIQTSDGTLATYGYRVSAR